MNPEDISKLISMLKDIGGDVWQSAVKQVSIYNTLNGFWLIVYTLIFIGSIWLAFKLYVKFKEDDGYDKDFKYILSYLLLGAVDLIFIVAFALTLSNFVTGVSNPEYAAYMNVLQIFHK